MKITRIEATSHRVPAKVPLLHEPIIREIVFVRVETDGGVTGYGLTGPIQRFAARELINREIAPLLIDKDPLATERHWYDLFYRLNPRAQTGAWSSAISAVDIALWDIKGKHLGQPVWRLLGGYSATVPAYITFGLLEYSREQLVEAAKQFIAQGHDKLKMVVAINGAQDPAEDAARVRAVREAVGDQVELMVDANYLFSFPVALDLAKRIEPYGIKWFEEPVYGNDARLLANLRRQTRIPDLCGSERGTQVAPPRALGPRGRGHYPAQRCLCRRLHRRREGRCHGAGLQHTDCQWRRLAAPQYALDRGSGQRLAGGVSCADVGDRRDDLPRPAEAVPWNGHIDRAARPWANTERRGTQRNAGVVMAMSLEDRNAVSSLPA